MSDIAIRAEGLGKLYRIGGPKQKYRTIRETIVDTATMPFQRARGVMRGEAAGGGHESFWALKNISFEVKHGEVVGIIGRNGAGKSTLLKVLSRITEPSAGYVDVYGRVGSLLEVGTGFHPELTGRENIYLNGAILGMTREEIARKFDEIVDFAEIEKFIDTPVKHYSSGMGLRLGFAVAAHLEPEILVVDEVLAVGDMNFQQKCLGKMDEVSQHGRTILFVSHNMAAIRQLCPKTMVINNGQIIFQGDTSEGINYYLSHNSRTEDGAVVDTRNYADRSGTGGGRIVRVGVEDEYGKATHNIGIGKPLRIWMEVELKDIKAPIVMGVEIKSREGVPLLNLRTDSHGITFGPYENPAKVKIQVEIPGLPFYPGIYILDPWFCPHKGKRADHLHGPLSITLEPQGLLASEQMIQPGRGIVLLDCDWRANEEKIVV
jgi:lipopolysaccharide transport system ATP-binding protein